MKRSVSVVLGALIAFGASQARADTFQAGSFIIPMDTTYQNSGMLKAYGLVYELLRNGVPVRWVIKFGKGFQAVDFVATAKDHKTNAVINAYGYRGGPFVIDSVNAAAALPIINAWQMANAATAVHEATAGFDGDVAKYLVVAPRVAMFADGNQGIARGYLQAAGIPDSTLDPTWPNGSPDMLDPVEVSGPTTQNHADGALFDADGDPVYCQFMSMHWGVNNALANPEVVAEVRQYLTHPTHFFAECQAVNAFENLVPYGHFLTPNGYLIKAQPANVAFHNFSSPFAQIDGAFATVGGSEPAYALPAGDSYKAGGITMITEANSAEGVWDLWMTGYLDGACPPFSDGCGSLGKVSYLGGHQYTTAVPITNNPKTQGVRLFLNSLFDSACASQSGFPSISLTKSGPAITLSSMVTFTINYVNSGPSVALNAVLTDTLPPGASFVSATNGGTYAAGKVTWNLGNLGDDEFGAVSVTVNFGSLGTYTNTAHLNYKVGLNGFGLDSNQTSTTYDIDSDGDGVLDGLDICPGDPNPLQDLSTDVLNCGACGNICPSANGVAGCVGGVCVLSCLQGYSDCNGLPQDGCEFDNAGFGVDEANCGGCGVLCNPLNASGLCVGGVCGLGTCNAGYSDCNGLLGDGCEYNDMGFATDEQHCGGCGVQCAAGFVCLSGVCTVSNCPLGLSDCNGLPGDGCEYNNTGFGNDPANCGGCGVVCSPAQATGVCTGGVCQIGVCMAGYSDCNGLPGDGCEYNNTGFGSDPANCGACGQQCQLAHAVDACSNGACVVASCDAGYSNCDGLMGNGCEYDNTGFGNDPMNCGGCGVLCNPANAAGSCMGGVCGVGMCDAGYVDLDGQAGNGCEYACTFMGGVDMTCDGQDDDCDGLMDEDYVPGTCGQGACVASALCVSGVENCTPLSPTLEGPPGAPTCSDGIDNDCNGDMDAMDVSCTGCMTAADCDDGNPCTDDQCVNSLCSHIGIANCGAGGAGGGGMGGGGMGGGGTGGGGTGGGGTGGGMGSSSTSSSGATSSSGSSSSGMTGSSTSSSASGGASSGGNDSGDEGGCACRAAGMPKDKSIPGLWLALGALMAVVGRRSIRRSS